MSQAFSVEGKRIIVTGAAGGIGQAIARRLAENGGGWRCSICKTSPLRLRRLLPVFLGRAARSSPM